MSIGQVEGFLAYGQSGLGIGNFLYVSEITIMINMHSMDKALLPGIQFGYVSIVSSDVREFLGASGSGFLVYQGHCECRRLGESS